MTRWPIAVASGALLLCTTLASGLPASAAADSAESSGLGLRHEIKLLHLINGLELTNEQMRFILDRAYQFRDLREQLLAEAKSVETQAALDEYRARLMQREPIEPNLTRHVAQIQHQQHRLVERIGTETTRLAEEVEGQLDGFQLFALKDYVACVIPPPGESKIGQAAEAGPVKGLERVRSLPDQGYRFRRQQLAEQTMRRLMYKLPVGFELPGGEQQELARILGIMDQARALPEVDFAVQKEDLAQQLGAPYDLKARPNKTITKITRHLLNPAIIPLLEARLGS